MQSVPLLCRNCSFFFCESQLAAGSVELVLQYGMSDCRHMDSNLMIPSCQQFTLNHTFSWISAQNTNDGTTFPRSNGIETS